MRGSRSKALPDRASVNCQYSMATFSTGERRRRPHGDRQAGELALQLKQTFEAAILTRLYPRSQIDIYVQVPGTGAGRRRGRARDALCRGGGQGGQPPAC